MSDYALLSFLAVGLVVVVFMLVVISKANDGFGDDEHNRWK